MTSLLTGLIRGSAAGAAGTTAIEITTQADMALRGRPASDSPTETVAALAHRTGVAVPGGRRERANRLQGLGGLSGAATGIAVGALAGALRAGGVRLPGVIGAPLLGAAAMIAADGSQVALGLADPRRWSTGDRVADAVPHLVYGIGTHATLAATFADDDRQRREHPGEGLRPATAGDLVRAALLGAATGARSSIGLTALALRARGDDAGLSGRLAGPVRRTLPALATAAEVGVDKHPAVPPRHDPTALVPRLTLAAGAAQATARRDGHEGGPGAVVATAAALGSSLGGMRLRSVLSDRIGSDLPGALAEDAAAALLAWAGTARRVRVAR